MAELPQIGLIACEKRELAQRLETSLACDIPVVSLHQLKSNGAPSVYIAADDALFSTRCNQGKTVLDNDGRSIVTGRIARGKNVPLNQPVGTVFLPWCSDELFANWLTILAGSCPARVYPHYFFLKSHADAPSSANQHILLQALESMATWESHLVSVANLAERAALTERHMRKLFPKIVGVRPGQLLRAMTVFHQTAYLMYEESKLRANCFRRYGNSPLSKFELETNCNHSERLKRLLGLEYRELATGARREHWAALWMRKWRQRASCFN